MERLAERYPGTAEELCALDHTGPFQLLEATILSAQSTDARVNMVTPTLFAAYPDPAALATANPEDVEKIIHSTGFFRSKAKSLVGMAAAVADRFDGTVPSDLADLVTLPGVGRKTANVVRSVAFGLPGLPVDTHVLRVTQRLGLLGELAPAERARRGQGGAGVERADPGRRTGCVQPPGDPPRPRDLRGPEAALRRMPLGRFLSVRFGKRRVTCLWTPF